MKPRVLSIAAAELPTWLFTPAALYVGLALLSLLSSMATVLIVDPYVTSISDEFANLLAGQTFARGALTNPPHPLWEFFETHHVLSQPTYMGKYPPALGLFIAVGIWLGSPLFGIWIASALLTAAAGWMTLGFFNLRWAWIAGIVAIGQYGLNCYWAQSYWSGAPAALGGCLVVGGVWRLLRGRRMRDSILLGAGAALLMISRPFEGLIFSLTPAGVIIWAWWRRRTGVGLLWPAAAVLASVGAFQLALNASVTGRWLQMPYAAYEEQYSRAPILIWQQQRPAPEFRHAAFEAYHRYFVEPNTRNPGPVALVWWERFTRTVRFHCGWLLGGAALCGLLLNRPLWMKIALLGLAIGSVTFALSFWYYYHYTAPLAGLFVLCAIHGLREIYCRRIFAKRRVWIATVLAAVYAASIARDEPLKRLPQNPLAKIRENVARKLRASDDRFVILVRMQGSNNLEFPYVFNDAAIDESQIIWAWDMGPDNNRRLRDYYPDRQFMVLTDSASEVTLERYESKTNLPAGP